MPIVPGRWDWTRNETSANTIMKSRLEKKKSRMSPFERKLFRFFIALLILAVLIYALLDIFIK